MKNSIMLSIIFLSISFTSFINAQAGLKIVKGGIKDRGAILEYEYLVNDRVSFIGGLTKKNQNASIEKGLGILFKSTTKRVAKSMGVKLAVRKYGKSFKEGANFYFEPNIQLEKVKGTETYRSNRTVLDAVGTVASTVSSTSVYVDERNQPKVKNINKINVVTALNYGLLYKSGHFIVDMSIGLGYKSLAAQTNIYVTGALKLGYAF